MRRATSGGWAVSVGALILAILAGSILIAFTDETVRETSAYFFARPMDTIEAVLGAVGRAYAALFRGSIWDFRQTEFTRAIAPLMWTLDRATPLIASGLGIALSFRAGLFNIGGQGQMLAAAVCAGAVALFVPMPFPIHMIVAIIAGLIGGAIWAAIAGALKAYTGAHEVISTIMLNWIAFYAVSYMVATPGLLQAPGSYQPKTAATPASAQMPALLGGNYRIHFGFILALIAVAIMWWILNRSKVGLHYRAVGLNPVAANAAGIDVKRTTVSVMLVAGAFVGLAGTTQVLGTVTTGFDAGVHSGIGFDALTVALLGRSQPIGVLFAGILFGAFKAGGATMQTAESIPIEIVLVIQSLIVLFIAAPPLVRAIFRLPQPDGKPRRKAAKPRRTKEVTA
ncbi:MAG TPA: ABC transporter permease [Actinomycetales bacterium]|nr:ABC transporter permease [Actinomycetales bacterium]